MAEVVALPVPEPGQLWQRRDGSRVRIKGFSKAEPGWVVVREAGGDREQASYPPTAFRNGAFVPVAEPGPMDRLMAKVAISESGCWLWQAGKGSAGYGRFWYDGETRNAHRVSYELHVGPIPDGLHIDHLCRVPACINPAHLEPVTCRENLLRGDTFQAANAAKTHCVRGHPLTGENVRIHNGRRICRACGRSRWAESHQ